jgi:hypothetical protein
MKQKIIRTFTPTTRPPDPQVLRVSLEQSILVTSQNTIQCTTGLIVLNYDYSYFAVNTGKNNALAYLQISPNNTIWETQSTKKLIFPGTVATFVSNSIAKYARLCYQSQEMDSSTTLTIYIQGR